MPGNDGRRFSLISLKKTIKVSTPEFDDQYPSRLEDYLRKIDLLKQIMSNKARFYRIVNGLQNFATVAVSSLLLFFGFSGTAKIHSYVQWLFPNSTIEMVEFAFNMVVFLLFVIGTLHLVFRFSDKQSQAERAIATLASLNNEIEDIISSRGNLVIVEPAGRIDYVRSRYESISENIPANSDREFKRAKKTLDAKDSGKRRMQIMPHQIFDPMEQEKILASIVLGSRATVDALRALQSVDEKLYLGGGLMRNSVWDFLHGYRTPTSVDDVDVVYFDKDDAEKRHDQAIETQLAKEVPNFRWSVKNQARMHEHNNEEQYASLNEAIERWPETATAFAVRLRPDGSLDILAPHGFSDLFSLVVRNTPAFDQRLDRVRERFATKGWKDTWPHLQLLI